MNVACADRSVDQLGKLSNARFGHHRRPPRPVRSNGAVVPIEISSLHIAQTRSPVARARATHKTKPHLFSSPSDQLAIEALADQQRETVVAKRPHTGQQTSMPEGIDSRRRDVEANNGAGFANMLEAKGGTEAFGDDARNPRNDCQDDALLQSELLRH